MKKNITPFLFVYFLLITLATKAQHNFFVDKDEQTIKIKKAQNIVKPSRYRTVALDTASLATFLKSLPLKSNSSNNINDASIIELPAPNGGIAKFQIWESSILAPELAKQFSELKTYSGQGINDKTATIKMDWTEQGFHAMILSSITGNIIIDPYSIGNKIDYITYFKSDYKNTENRKNCFKRNKKSKKLKHL